MTYPKKAISNKFGWNEEKAKEKEAPKVVAVEQPLVAENISLEKPAVAVEKATPKERKSKKKEK